jgi:hypothetical protein
MAAEHDVIELVMLDYADHVVDMGLQIDVAACEMRALAKAGERRRVDAVALGAQRLGDALPHPIALPGAVDEDEGRLA